MIQRLLVPWILVLKAGYLRHPTLKGSRGCSCRGVNSRLRAVRHVVWFYSPGPGGNRI
ncbi:hypothetical protein DPMN_059016 [Dreissena polymorpha]|uniref:Uncharacterized protein n=1 Tax=Dreissena polymorpha TaxID=45954 RepID=A0A9D4HEG7_DREPO|nr:hypothetical protein DPMN_059016 [Dreissena polymorpha]